MVGHCADLSLGRVSSKVGAMRRITVVLGLLMAFGLAVMTDLAFSSWRDFWQTHSMLTGLVSSALLLGITGVDRRRAA